MNFNNFFLKEKFIRVKLLFSCVLFIASLLIFVMVLHYGNATYFVHDIYLSKEEQHTQIDTSNEYLLDYSNLPSSIVKGLVLVDNSHNILTRRILSHSVVKKIYIRSSMPKYYIQFLVTTNKNYAQKVLFSLHNAGFNVYIKVIKLSKTLYIVRSKKNFRTKEAAKSMKMHFKG